ncbi:MAG: hypothetical protein C7B46_05440 [Sulfobacillus benefaciens]|uniref:Major facilitator superfamily (MFS) profile domain-containing protein n=1 Tax=Sulfobacillus benefaciens TaxID=453960 RepID=A0A2T2XIP0_9FIRM|nr:MAG: hypothetical protein C7B46_05440 [Sulfobacillus benefaciens]
MVSTRRLASSVLLATFLAAWDSTVVGTIGPSIAQHLGGLAWYPWMLTGFMIAATVITPLVGHLTSEYPPESLYRGSIAIFLLGSIGSASALSMGWFIATRILQGIGAGGILTLGLILTGQYYQGLERIRMQGRLSAMWGLAGLLGPTLGGMMAQWVSWRGLFVINVLIGTAAFAALGPLASTVRPTKGTVDWAGALWLAGGLTAGVSSVTAFQQDPRSILGWILLGMAVGLGLGWWRTERHSSHPLIPLNWLKDPRITVPSLLAMTAGGTLYAAVLIIPLWLHIAWQFSPVDVGLAILPLPVGWAAGSLATAPIMERMRLSSTVQAGMVGIIAGMSLNEFAGGHSHWLWIVLGGTLLGIGVGVVIMATLNSVQSKIPRDELGSATGLYNLGRTLGNTLGPGVIGGLVLLLWKLSSGTHSTQEVLSFTQAVHQVFSGVLILWAILLIVAVTNQNRHPIRGDGKT